MSSTTESRAVALVWVVCDAKDGWPLRGFSIRTEAEGYAEAHRVQRGVSCRVVTIQVEYPTSARQGK